MKNLVTLFCLTMISFGCAKSSSNNSSPTTPSLAGKWLFAGATCTDSSGNSSPMIYQGVSLELEITGTAMTQVIQTSSCAITAAGGTLVLLNGSIYDEIGGPASAAPSACTASYSTIFNGITNPVNESESSFPITMPNVTYSVVGTILTRTAVVGNGVTCALQYNAAN